MGVEPALTPDSRWDIAVAGLVDAASAAGFCALGISAEKVDAETVSTFASAGLRCHELLALLLSDDEAATLCSAKRLAKAAMVMGAPWVLTVFRTGLSTGTAKVIERCAAMFAEASALYWS